MNQWIYRYPIFRQTIIWYVSVQLEKWETILLGIFFTSTHRSDDLQDSGTKKHTPHPQLARHPKLNQKNHRKVRNIAICGVFCTCMAHPQSQNGKWVNTCKHHVLFILRQTIFSATPTHLTPKFALKRNFIPSQGPFTKPWISPIRGTSKFHHPRQASRGITLSGPTHTPSPTLRKKS